DWHPGAAACTSVPRRVVRWTAQRTTSASSSGSGPEQPQHRPVPVPVGLARAPSPELACRQAGRQGSPPLSLPALPAQPMLCAEPKPGRILQPVHEPALPCRTPPAPLPAPAPLSPVAVAPSSSSFSRPGPVALPRLLPARPPPLRPTPPSSSWVLGSSSLAWLLLAGWRWRLAASVVREASRRAGQVRTVGDVIGLKARRPSSQREQRAVRAQAKPGQDNERSARRVRSAEPSARGSERPVAASEVRLYSDQRVSGVRGAEEQQQPVSWNVNPAAQRRSAPLSAAPMVGQVDAQSSRLAVAARPE
ncbi:Intersectin-1, partial [Frankliniella fusca]